MLGGTLESLSAESLAPNGDVTNLLRPANASPAASSSSSSLSACGRPPSVASSKESGSAPSLPACSRTSSMTPALSAASDMPIAGAGAPATAPTAARLAAANAAAQVVPQMAAPSSSPSPARDASAILNPAKMLNDIGGERTMMHRLLSKFAERSSPTIEAIRRAAEAREYKTLQREAHSLKGSSDYVASSCLRAAALALQKAAEEALAGNEPEPPIAAHVIRVASEMDLVLTAIQTELQGAAPGVVATPNTLPTVNPRADVQSTVAAVPPPTAPPPPSARSASALAATLPQQPAPAPPPPSVASSTADDGEDGTVLHWANALANFGGEEPILRRLLTKFQERAKPTLEKIRRAAREGDLRLLQREAYSLKGSAGYIAASRLQHAAIAFEQAVEQAINTPTAAERPAGIFDVHIERYAAEQRTVLAAIAARLAPS